MLYVQVARTGYRRNVAYMWSHMLNNLASAVFGFMYIYLWQAVAPERAGSDPYTRSLMTGMMALAQVLAWVTTFLPGGLGIAGLVRTGAIATEMGRPVPFLWMVMARESGNLVYQFIYRSLPLAVLFALTTGMPAPASWTAALLAVPSVVLGAYVALCLFYTVGMSALWTTEVRWAHWANYSLSALLSGGWIPADVLPGWLGKVAPYLPWACEQYYPLRLYLGLSGAAGLLVQLAWAAALTLWCWWLTRAALRRVVVQGG